MSARIADRVRCASLALMMSLLVGCAGSETIRGRDPIEIAFDGEQQLRDRLRAVEAIWEDAEAGELPMELTRERLADIAWDYGELEPLRRAVVDALLSDRTPEGDEHSRQLFLAMLPTEPSVLLAQLYLEAIEERGWTGAETALVRSLSRPMRGVELEDRPELALLADSARSLDEIVFGVFIGTELQGDVREKDLIARRTREDAWNLLNRVQPDRERVGALIRQTSGEDPWLQALRAGERDFGIVPMTGQELDWLVQLVTDEQAWWQAVKSVFDSLPEREKQDVALRHLEPLRWASEHRIGWLEASRASLVEDLRGRLDGRRVHERSADQVRTGRGNDERLDDWLDRLTRLDLLSILVVDEALRLVSVHRVLFEELAGDLDDRRTEFGGSIVTRDDGGFRARAYRPRSGERGGDTVYIAPPDLYIDGATSLAFWHLHAPDLLSRSYAGPSRPDLIRAAASGRTSLVFTSLGPGRLNADIYLPNGAAIDLGEIREP